MSNAPESEVGATVRFTADEAVVLFELLSRWSGSTNAGDTPSRSCFVSTAEGAALNGLLGALERQLVAPLKADYDRILGEAQARLAHGWDYPTLRG